MSTISLGLKARKSGSDLPPKRLVLAGFVAAGVAIAYSLTLPSTAFATNIQASLQAAATPASGTGLSAADLDHLLNVRFGPVNDAVTAQGSSAATQVNALLNAGDGTTSADGNLLTVNVPAVSGLNASVNAALAPIAAHLALLNGQNGQIAASVNGNVTKISPLLNLNSPGATITANVPINLDGAVGPALGSSTSSGAVTMNPANGTIVIDLSKLLSADPTNQSGTVDTLSPAVQALISADINNAAADLGANLVNSATDSVVAAPVSVNANLHVLTQPAATGTGSASTGDTTATGAVTTGALGGLLGGLGNVVNGAVGTVANTVDGALNAVSNLLPSLLTTLSLNLGGTVGQTVGGTAPATGSVSLLGQPAPFNAGGISNGVGNAIINNIVGPIGTGSSSAGSGTGTATGCPAGDTLDVCLNANTNLGGLLNGNGSGLLNGNLLGGNGLLGTGLLEGNGLLNGTGSPWLTVNGLLSSNGNLLGTDGTGLGVSVNANTGSGTGTGGGSNLLNVNVGSGANGSASGSTGQGNLLTVNGNSVIGNPLNGNLLNGNLLNIGG